NATAWLSVPPVPASNVFLLPRTAKVRFQSANNGNGTATLSFRAWDGTAGTATKLFAVSATGAAHALSAEQTTARMAVQRLNPPPPWTGGGASVTPVTPGSYSLNSSSPAGDTVTTVFGAYFNDIDANPVGIAITALTGTTSGTWQYSRDDGLTWNKI